MPEPLPQRDEKAFPPPETLLAKRQ